jgi:hypothetical protein
LSRTFRGMPTTSIVWSYNVDRTRFFSVKVALLVWLMQAFKALRSMTRVNLMFELTSMAVPVCQ